MSSANVYSAGVQASASKSNQVPPPTHNADRSAIAYALANATGGLDCMTRLQKVVA